MMNMEQFKKMMQNRFGLDGKVVTVAEERPDYVRMEADISIPGIPMKLIDDLHWRRDEIDFAQTLENERVELLGFYHRTSRNLKFDQRCFYFVITGTDAEKYPLYISLYQEDGEALIRDEKDFFFPKNDKHDQTEDVLKEDRQIRQALIAYYAPKFKAAV